MHFSFSEETYTKKEAWDNSEISTVKCVSELSLGSRPFLVGDSMQLPFFFFPLFFLSEALKKVFCQENNFHFQQCERFLSCTSEDSHLNTHALQNKMRRKYGVFFFLRPDELNVVW